MYDTIFVIENNQFAIYIGNVIKAQWQVIDLSYQYQNVSIAYPRYFIQDERRARQLQYSLENPGNL